MEVVEATSPEPGPGEVLVAVSAIGVNFADCVVRMGLYESATKYVGWPITPGFEFAGRVVRTGQGVENHAPGDRVFGVTRFGAYQTELVVSQAQLFRTPDAWSDVDAGGFPVAFLTAWYALRELCRLRPDQRVLVHSAAGGVGGAAIQIARTFGAQVIGVVGSSHKEPLAKELGCEMVIDKSNSDLWGALRARYPDGVDVVLDPNGQATLKQGYKHLRPTGRLVIYGFQTMLSRGRGVPNPFRLLWTYLTTPRFDPLAMANENKSVLAFNLSYLFEHSERLREAMNELLAWVEQGAIRPLPSETFPFERVADAQRSLQSGQTTGKLVLTTNTARIETSTQD